MDWIQNIPSEFFSWWWAAWLAIGFGVPEALALARKKTGDTLSEHVWRVAGIKGFKIKRFVKWRRLALLTLLAWLAGHFLGGGYF